MLKKNQAEFRRRAERDFEKEHKFEIEIGAFFPARLVQYSIGRRMREYESKLVGGIIKP